jgi:hypothetical protein
MSKNQNWNINHSWSQPYDSLNAFFQGQTCREIYNKLTLEEEIDKLEMVDRWVDSMLTFPDAEAIMNKIKEKGND